ncbi:MAG TPA: NUDIX hydrolase [Streptosporangiaceae bacterium]|jgi:8-oxo-dGTP pyrophosphatase MutT (NUDIX family)
MGLDHAMARCGRGHVHTGRYGAAGLLVYCPDGAGEPYILLQQRALWGTGGGTWGLFGGGRLRDEDPIAAALRETAEECTLEVSVVRLHGVMTDDHGGWAFHTVVGTLGEPVPVRPASMESRRAEWVRADEVDRLRLFAPFAENWARLRATAMTRLCLVVDAANVVGSRPDGWWRDRAGAAARLRDQLAELARRGVPYPPFDVCYPEVVLVVEGKARDISADADGPVRVVAARGSGDDAIVDVVAAREEGVTYLVVTADRELRARCEAVGASVTGPRRLLDQLG